jgi:predicted SAM-dependent methyltransferase
MFTTFAKRMLEKTYISTKLGSEIRFESHLLFVRWNYRLNPRVIRRRRSLLEADNVKLHYGCGPRILPGWINIDAFYSPGIDIQMDLRMPLPLRNNSTRLIFAEHVLEHMDAVGHVPRILGEFHRILKPGGCVRIIVPDLRKYGEAFVRRDFEWLTAARPDCSTHTEAMNSLFYDHFHRFIYDSDALSQRLQQAGFTNIVQTRYGESRCPELALDLPEIPRSRESLCIEASKPTFGS